MVSFFFFFLNKSKIFYLHTVELESQFQVPIPVHQFSLLEVPVIPPHPERVFIGSLGYSLTRSPNIKCKRIQGTVMGQLEHTKALTALTDGQLQHLVQLLVGVVGGEAQLVETRQKSITESQLMSQLS